MALGLPVVRKYRARCSRHHSATMDTALEPLDTSTTAPGISYDDTVPYEHQVTAVPDALDPTEAGRSLADRIGTTKVYLLSDASKSRAGKVRWQLYLRCGMQA